jgi:hypothetical protein
MQPARAEDMCCPVPWCIMPRRQQSTDHFRELQKPKFAPETFLKVSSKVLTTEWQLVTGQDQLAVTALLPRVMSQS